MEVNFLYYVFGIILSSGTITTLLYKLFEKAIIEKITLSIKHEYDLKLENYRNEFLIKQKAALIADLFAEWMTIPEPSKATKKDYQRMNQLTFEAFIWLPEEIAFELNKTLTHKVGAKDARMIILDVRNHLMMEKSEYKYSDVTFFVPDENPNKAM